MDWLVGSEVGWRVEGNEVGWRVEGKGEGATVVGTEKTSNLRINYQI